jgi:hypothetical protein
MTPMGKVIIQIPLVTWRDGQPRYWPSAAQRALGFRFEDLRHHNGVWFTLPEAQSWSEKRQVEIAAAKQAAKLKPAKKPAQARAAAWVTLSQVCDVFLASPRMRGAEVREGRKVRQGLAANTVRYYKQGQRLLEQDAIWHECLRDCSTYGVESALHRIEVGHGLAQARCARALLVQVFKSARKDKHMAHNPLEDISLPMPAPRVRYAEPDQILHFVAVADCLGRADIGDAIMLGVWSGQRQNDRLALCDAQDTKNGILFRQNKKHGQPLLIPKSGPLAARISAARLRRRGWRVQLREVLIDETTNSAWKADWYRKVFATIRHAAAHGTAPQGRAFGLAPNIDVAAALAAAGLEAMPALADLRDQDLRDTAVTWLALAGCTEHEIASITGHSLKTIKDIMSHYLGMHPDHGRRAIAKMEKWSEQ